MLATAILLFCSLQGGFQACEDIAKASSSQILSGTVHAGGDVSSRHFIVSKPCTASCCEHMNLEDPSHFVDFLCAHLNEQGPKGLVKYLTTECFSQVAAWIQCMFVSS